MEFFLPSLFTVLFAMIVVVGIFPKMTPLFLALFAIGCLVLALRNHYAMFGQEYIAMTWSATLKSAAPTILVGTVILFSIGYILFLYGSGTAPTLRAPPASIPPPETSTNMITNAIGNGLAAAGIANISANVSKNLVSASPSLKKNLTNTELQSILASRLSKQV